MDSRLDILAALGLDPRAVHLLQNAGGRVSPDVIRSVAISTRLFGTPEMGIVHHTDCALHVATDEMLREATGVKEIDFLTFADLELSVRHDINALSGCGILPEGFHLWGAVYDLDSRAIRKVCD